MTELSVADVLERAADLIEPEGAWVQRQLGYDARGERIATSADIKNAVCFCAAGAIWRVWADGDLDDRGSLVWAAFGRINRGGREQGVGPWNDAPERTQAEVVAALRRAATLARQGDA